MVPSVMEEMPSTNAGCKEMPVSVPSFQLSEGSQAAGAGVSADAKSAVAVTPDVVASVVAASATAATSEAEASVVPSPSTAMAGV